MGHWSQPKRPQEKWNPLFEIKMHLERFSLNLDRKLHQFSLF